MAVLLLPCSLLSLRMASPVNDIRIRSIDRLRDPLALKAASPLTEDLCETVTAARKRVEDILCRKDKRLLVIVGPCSIHDPVGALEYAQRLVKVRNQLQDHVEILMRVYFEKPRTTIGWKGFIDDPYLDNSHNMEIGLQKARQLLVDILKFGLPAATEFLDPIVPQYIADLVSWAAIGARTTESQTHRQMASGLSMPVGFKNGTEGDCQSAYDAMSSARSAHSFLGIDQHGHTAVIHAKGNPFGHLVLRGGRARPNYDPASIANAVAGLKKANLPPYLMVDCSHANSGKKHTQQEIVWYDILKQRQAAKAQGTESPIIGLMLESYIFSGTQPMPAPGQKPAYGISITDACIAWEETEVLLNAAARAEAEGSR